MKTLTIECLEAPSFDTGDLVETKRAFHGRSRCALRQAWLEKEEADFKPASVSVGWRDDLLLVFAELNDVDIYSDATGHNQRMWKLGDTFEMYLQPVGQKPYAEFHVTPNNFRLQLRYPDADTIARVRQKIGTPEDYLIHGQAFRSRTWIQSDEQKWFVLAEIPAQSVCEQPGPFAGSQWRFSFSRFDYTRSRREPVISSTSPHPEPDFHRQTEWGTIGFRS